MEFVENIKYFMLCQKYNWKSFFTYRLQSLIWMIVSGFNVLIIYIPITIIYTISSGIPDWTYFQLLLLSSTASFVLDSVWYLIVPREIVNSMRTGELDKYLLRPFDKITCILSAYPGNLTGIVEIIGFLSLTIYCIINLNLPLTSIVIFFSTVAIGVAALTMMFLFITILAYKSMNSAQFTHSILNISKFSNSYPLGIYGNVIQLIFTLILPIGFAVYYPVQVLLGMTTPLFTIILIFAFAIIIIITKLGFDNLIKSYSSGGG